MFYHNAMDIVSLSVLMTRIAELFIGERVDFEHGEDAYGVGHYHYFLQNYELAEKYYNLAMQYALPYDTRYRLLTELSLLLKRTSRLDEASEIWAGMIEGQNEYNIFPYEELAKYYEHYKRSFKSAVQVVQTAI